MAELQIRLLGQPQVTQNGVPLVDFSTAKTEALFYFLAVTGRPHPREMLADLLWAEMPEAKAKRNLTKAVSILRKLVEPYLIIEHHTIAFNQEASYWLDVAVFQAAVETSAPEQNVSLLQEAVELYQGEFLKGFYVKEALPFEEWVLQQRERLRELMLQALDSLVTQHLNQADYATGIEYASRLLALDPWRESAHRQMMILLARSGQRNAALAQYESCRQILADELDVEPMAETTALYERLKIATSPPAHNLPLQPDAFVGREKELSQIATHLDNPNCRLLTIVGPGGIGKTRLALQGVSRYLKPEMQLDTPGFAGGVYLVSLAPLDPSEINNPASVTRILASAIAHTLKISLQDSQDPLRRLVDHLRQAGPMLLLLDNFEYLFAPPLSPPQGGMTGGATPQGGMKGEASPEGGMAGGISSHGERLGRVSSHGGMPREILSQGGMPRGGASHGGMAGGAELLDHLLQRVPSIKLLVISRERLNLRQEWVMEIGGLEFPTTTAPHLSELAQAELSRLSLPGLAEFGPPLLTEQETGKGLELEHYSAIALFLQRAQQAQAGFTLSEGEKLHVVRICQLVEGLPLALELAASWLRSSSCAEIVTRIEKGLDFLTTSVRNVPVRHRSLRAVFEHSWELLSPEEQKIFRHLSVFRGGFQREAAEEVAGASLSMLGSLIDKSLLRRTPSERYEIHELLRQYAAEKLAQLPAEQAAVQDRHSHYYAKFLQQRGKQVKGEEEARILAELSAEADNIRAGWQRAIGSGQALTMAEINQYWYLGRFEQAAGLYQKSLAALRPPDPAWDRGLNLHQQGFLAYQKGDYVAAKRRLTESLSVLRAADDSLYAARSMVILGMVTHDLGDYVGAEQLLWESRIALEAVGENRYRTYALGYLGQARHALGQPQSTELEKLLWESLAISREVGDSWAVAHTLKNLGSLHHLTADTEAKRGETRALLQESITIFQEINDKWGLASALSHLIQVNYILGDYGEAGQQLHYVLQLAGKHQFSPILLTALVSLVSLRRELSSLLSGKDNRSDLELLQLVMTHPASSQATREQARRLLAEFQPDLPDSLTGPGPERVRSRSLEAIVAQILSE